MPIAMQRGASVQSQQKGSSMRVCSQAGISAAKENVLTFQKLSQGIDASLQELAAARKREQLVSKAFLVLKFTKATCDAFIGLAAEMSGSKGAKMVKAGYGVGSVIAETAGTAAAGGDPDYLKASTAALKAGSGFVSNKGASYLIKSTAIKTELLTDAAANNQKGVKKNATSYFYELGRFTLDVVEAKKSKAFLGIAKEAYDYDEKLRKAFDEILGFEGEASERYHSARANFTIMARQFQKKIVKLQAFIASCEAELGIEPEPQPAPQATMHLAKR